MICRHFDKEKSGRLNHQEFKSCLRSLGYDLPMVEEGEPDPEFEAILDTVDPNRWVSCAPGRCAAADACTCACRDGNVSLQEYMAFMISRETENVKSSEEIESAFRALSTESKPYVTKEELYQVRAGVRAPVWTRVPSRSNRPPSPAEPDQGAGRLLPVPHEALPGQQRARAAVGLRLRGVHPLALRQLTNQDARLLPPAAQHEAGGWCCMAAPGTPSRSRLASPSAFSDGGTSASVCFNKRSDLITPPALRSALCITVATAGSYPAT